MCLICLQCLRMQLRHRRAVACRLNRDWPVPCFSANSTLGAVFCRLALHFAGRGAQSGSVTQSSTLSPLLSSPHHHCLLPPLPPPHIPPPPPRVLPLATTLVPRRQHAQTTSARHDAVPGKDATILLHARRRSCDSAQEGRAGIGCEDARRDAQEDAEHSCRHRTFWSTTDSQPSVQQGHAK
jgi:hypothetical protein